MKIGIKLAIIFLAACALSHAQAVPDATGSNGLPVINNLHYSVRYSQSEYLYGSQINSEPNQVMGIASGNLDYIYRNERYPLTLNYGGGYMWPISGPSIGTGLFQHLSFTQGIVQRRWNLMGSENVSYTPQAPLAGFSGVPGTGEPVGAPTAGSPSQSVLTVNTRSLSNSANVQLGYRLNYSTTLNIGGGSQLLRFPDGNGVDSDGLDGTAGITRRLSALSSLAAQYMFSRYSFGASPYTGGVSGSFETNTVSLDYTRSWSRNLKTDVSVGPQWITASNSGLAPPTQTVAVQATTQYRFRAETAFVNYNRGISGGVGSLPGATIDTVTGGISRIFARALSMGITGSYFHTAALTSATGDSNAWFGGIQASERLGPFFSFLANYTAVDQTSGMTPSSNVLNSYYQVVSFGIAYSPREARRAQ